MPADRTEVLKTCVCHSSACGSAASNGTTAAVFLPQFQTRGEREWVSLCVFVSVWKGECDSTVRAGRNLSDESSAESGGYGNSKDLSIWAVDGEEPAACLLQHIQILWRVIWMTVFFLSWHKSELCLIVLIGSVKLACCDAHKAVSISACPQSGEKTRLFLIGFQQQIHKSGLFGQAFDAHGSDYALFHSLSHKKKESQNHTLVESHSRYVSHWG